jgi:hypothetical protein
MQISQKIPKSGISETLPKTPLHILLINLKVDISTEIFGSITTYKMKLPDLQRVYTISPKWISNTMLIRFQEQHKIARKHQKHYQSNTAMGSRPKALIQLYCNGKMAAMQQQPKLI